MGYRSEINIKITNDKFPELYILLHQHNITIDHLAQDDKYSYITMDSLKWYTGYPDVDAINKYIDTNSDHAALIRIGEEDGDIESFGDPDSVDLYYYTEVVFDGFDTTDELTHDKLASLYPELTL